MVSEINNLLIFGVFKKHTDRERGTDRERKSDGQMALFFHQIIPIESAIFTVARRNKNLLSCSKIAITEEAMLDFTARHIPSVTYMKLIKIYERIEILSKMF